jgi:hypothetical protein
MIFIKILKDFPLILVVFATGTRSYRTRNVVNAVASQEIARTNGSHHVSGQVFGRVAGGGSAAGRPV